MVGLIAEISARAALAVIIACLSTIAFDALLTLGESRFQIVTVLAFYVYCGLVVILPSGRQLFHVLSIPILTQFLHLFQKYTFPAGANSLWRLAPFLLVDLYLIHALLRFKTNLTLPEKCAISSWIAINFLFIAISPNLQDTIAGAFTLFLITLPAYFLYLNILSKSPSFAPDLEQSLCLLFIILALGTFGLVFFGARYKESDVLLVTRNISDTNVTMAYFILLWPFVLFYIKRIGNMLPLTLLMTLMFSVVVMLSFSRGAVFIVAPYIVFSLFIGERKKRFFWLAAVGTGLGMAFTNLIGLVDADVAYSWELRFADLHSVGPVMRKLQEASGRTDIHRLAYNLFLESPVCGHGTASFEKLGPGYREAHSMLFTALAEQGLIGTLYLYSLFLGLGYRLLESTSFHRKNWLLTVALAAYLLFVHSVGSVFVIIPSKSLTINCIAPLLLICFYYYAKSSATSLADRNNG
jgi:O-antigen ligase